MTSLAKNIFGFSHFCASKSKIPFQQGQKMKPTIGFFFRPIREEHHQTQGLLALLHSNEMFCLDNRCPTPSVKQQMWLSTPGGKDYLKCHFRAHTESQESSWLPGSQALSPLPLKVFCQNTSMMDCFTGPQKSNRQACEVLRLSLDKYLPLKMCLHLVLVSAKKINELCGLSVVKHSREWSSCTCTLIPGFLAKTQNNSVPDLCFEEFAVLGLCWQG